MIKPVNASQMNLLNAAIQKYGLADGRTEPDKQPVRTSIFTLMIITANQLI